MTVNIFAMPSSSVILLLLAAFGISNALPWTGPQATHVYREDAWSPAPTFVPVDPKELFRRDSVDVNVCGWIGGNSASSATCSSGSSCIRDTIHGYIGCCTTSGACTAGVYTGCIDSNSVGWSPNSGLQDNGIYTCTGTSVCYKNTYPGGYFQYGCGALGDAAQVATTYSGQPSNLLLQIVYTGVNFTPTSAVPSTTTSSSVSTTGSSSSSASTMSSASSSASTTGSSSRSASTMSSASSSSQSSTLSTSQTVAVAGKSSSNPTAVAASASKTASPSSKTSAGVIAGSTISGVAALAALIGALLWFCRRRKNKNTPLRAGSFITQHQPGQFPVSGPFQRIAPYSPEHITAPLTGNPTNPNQHILPQEQDITGAFAHDDEIAGSYSYGGGGISDTQISMSQPSTSTFTQSYYNKPRSQSQPSESAPLVSSSLSSISEIDDFSRGYHNAISAQDTQIHTAPDTIMGLGMGAGMGIGAPLRRSGTGTGTHYPTQSRELTSEAFRSSQRARAAGDEGWSPQGLSGGRLGATLGQGLNLRGGSGESSHASSNGQGSSDLGFESTSSNASQDGSRIEDEGQGGNGDESLEIEIPPKSPLRKSMMGRGLGMSMGNYTYISAGDGGGAEADITPRTAAPVARTESSRQSQSQILKNSESSKWDNRPRYQLVDEILERDDVPILHSPKQLRSQRQERKRGTLRGTLRGSWSEK